jgi:hypothetical protein
MNEKNIKILSMTVALEKGFEPQFTSKSKLSALFLKQQAWWVLT